MNHRVSIVFSSTSTTESGLGSPEVCSKASCLSISFFSKKCVHCTFSFLIVKPCAEFTCSSPLVLCHSHFLSRVKAQQWSPRKDQALHSIGSFRPFLLALSFFLCQLTIHNRALHCCLCVASFKLLMKKSAFPTAMCFRRRHSIRLVNT